MFKSFWFLCNNACRVVLLVAPASSNVLVCNFLFKLTYWIGSNAMDWNHSLRFTTFTVDMEGKCTSAFRQRENGSRTAARFRQKKNERTFLRNQFNSSTMQTVSSLNSTSQLFNGPTSHRWLTGQAKKLLKKGGIKTRHQKNVVDSSLTSTTLE